MTMTLQTTMMAAVDDRLVPGVSWAHLKGKRQTVQVYGRSQWQPTPKPLHAGMLYDLASLTKVVGTTPLFLQALAAGKVALDTPIATWLPAFTQPTTFRQALTHTSGLAGYIPHRDELAAPALKQALLTQLTTTAEVDQKVAYHDVNLLLVGWALEAMYQAPVQDLITQRVLHPMHLAQATFGPDAANSVPTTYSERLGLRAGLVHDPKSAILGEHSGAAGLFASLDDLITFAQVMLGQRTTSAFHTPWPEELMHDYTKNQLDRSLGWDLRTGRGGLWLYHTGYTGTFMLLSPQLQEALIVLTNRVHPTVNPDFLPWRDALIAKFIGE